jgi:hypothetical protein
VHLLVFRDCMIDGQPVDAGSVVKVPYEQLQSTMQQMKTFFGLLREVRSMASEKVDVPLPEPFVAILAQESYAFWFPWFEKKHYIKLLEGRLDLSKPLGPEVKIEDRPEYYDEDGFYILDVVNHGLTGAKIPNPPTEEWCRRHFVLGRIRIATVTSATPGRASALVPRTSETWSHPEFHALIARRKASGHFVAVFIPELATFVHVGMRSTGSGYAGHQKTHGAQRILTIPGLGVLVGFTESDFVPLLEITPKVMLGDDGVKFVDIPDRFFNDHLRERFFTNLYDANKANGFWGIAAEARVPEEARKQTLADYRRSPYRSLPKR